MKKSLPLIIVCLLGSACGQGGGGSSGGSSTTPTPAPPSDDLGITVISNQIISVYSTDMCTQYAGELCVFNGGQRVSFNDGSVFLVGAYSAIYDSGSGDTDSDQTSVSLFFPQSTTTGYLKLSGLVARGSTGYKALYLVWTRSPETLKLIHDTTGNNSPLDAGDETIATLSLSNW